MTKVEKFVANANITLCNKTKELEGLEAEKAQILSKFNCATKEDKEQLLKQIKDSEEKYSRLFEEVLEINLNIKKTNNKLKN